MAAQDKTTDKEQQELFLRRRRKRSIAIALALGVLVVIFYAITVIQVGPEVMVRDL